VRPLRSFAALALSLCIWLASLQPSHADDRRSDPTRLRIATFNAEFLWDGRDPEDGEVNFPRRGNPEAADEHLARIAEVIRRVDADVVNLVEVENLDTLNRLNDEFLVGAGYNAYLIDGLDTATGQDVALLTRIDPDQNRIDRSDISGRSRSTLKRVSKNYIAKIAVKDQTFALIGVHFLAFPDRPSRRAPRQAQANAIATLAADLRARGFLPVVLGDLNDFDAEVLDRNSNRPLADVLEQLKTLNTPTPSDDLFNASEFVAQPERFSAFFDRDRDGRINPSNELSAIDHILLPIDVRAQVVSVAYDHAHDPTLVSDHFPLVVTLRVNGRADIVPAAALASPVAVGSVRIASLLPDPRGDDALNETVTLLNASDESVDLSNWELRDRGGKVWKLNDLALAPGQRLAIRRDRQSMSLNNSGDTIELIASNGNVVDRVTYTGSSPGAAIAF